MNDEYPLRMPAPDTLAQMCMIHAWNDHTDDDSRVLLEQAYHTILSLKDRNVLLAKRNETLEAKLQ